MIDLHCHILPGVDDGSPDAETSLSMARHAAESGVTAIAVTPHCNLPGFRRNYRGPDYRRRLNDLRELLTQENIPLRLYSGAEVFADPSNIRTLIEQHELITLGGSRYLLVEFDFGLPGSVLLRTLEAIAQRGLVPVVAHPERYDAVQRDPRRNQERKDVVHGQYQRNLRRPDPAEADEKAISGRSRHGPPEGRSCAEECLLRQCVFQ